MRKVKSNSNLTATKDVSSAVREMNGPITLENGVTYEGEWLDGLRDGQGKQVWPCGSYYEGDWKRG